MLAEQLLDAAIQRGHRVELEIALVLMRTGARGFAPPSPAMSDSWARKAAKSPDDDLRRWTIFMLSIVSAACASRFEVDYVRVWQCRPSAASTACAD